MNKIIVSSLVIVIAFGANVASAQSYFPTYTYGPTTYQTPAQTAYQPYQTTYQQPYYGACVNLVSDLSYGSSGAQVRLLQTFLVSRNYPGGGAWMITGNFRLATQTAVRNFQMEQGLSQTGVVDASTRAAIARVSCLPGQGGGSSGYNNYSPYNYSTVPTYTYNNNNNYNNNTNTNCYYTYPYTCNNNTNNYGYGVTLTSLSPVSGQAGTSITIYGTNLDYYNNTVYFGNQPIANVPSINGTSLTVTVPVAATPGSLGVYVTNSRGTSNTLTFSVIATYGCNTYPYNYGSYGSTYCPPTTNNPNITYLNPTSGAVGSTVTIYGSGFSYSGNTVRFGGGIITGLSSFDGRTISFVVPSQLSGSTSQYVTLGTYNVSVSTANGQTSNALPFSVTSTGGSYGAPIISSVNGPTSLTTGTSGTWTIVVNNQNNTYLTTSVRWGDEGAYTYSSSPQTTYVSGTNTLTFTHTYNTPGTYNAVFTVANSSGQQNTATASVTVTGSNTSGNVSLSYLTPTSGRVGTQVMLQGTGFNALDNTVRFGIGGTLHVPSFNNGTTIYYTIPAYVSPCDIVIPSSNTVCAQNVQQIVPGPVQLYVTNSAGTTQTLMFQVQQ